MLTGTNISSIVFQELYELRQISSIYIACVFCGFKDQEQQTAASMTSVLIQQLLRQMNQIPGWIQEKYERSKRESRRPSVSEWIDILRKLIFGTQTFVVIDALDECNNDTAQALISIVRDLSSIRAMITARKDFPTPRKSQSNMQKIEIEAHDEDLRSYLSWKLDQHPLTLDQDDFDRVVETVIRGSSGM